MVTVMRKAPGTADGNDRKVDESGVSALRSLSLMEGRYSR